MCLYTSPPWCDFQLNITGAFVSLSGFVTFIACLSSVIEIKVAIPNQEVASDHILK